MKLKQLLIFLFLFVICLCGVFLLTAQAQKAATAENNSRQPLKIKLYFFKDDPDVEEMVAVTRYIKPTNRVAEAALRELLKGVSDIDRKDGLQSSYSVESMITGRDECGRHLIKPLADYLIGVSVKKGVATVNFREPAGCYLQTTIAMQTHVMGPIEATLKQFKSIKEVQYALDGKVITEWDA